MKGILLSINPDLTIVDVTHAVPPQDVRHGAVIVDQVADYLPQRSINIVVVDPGVGSRRDIVCVQFDDRHFICPDNGLLTLIASRKNADRIVRLTNPRFWRASVSATFHGRDIMAPAAAHLSLGIDPLELGEPLAQLKMLDWPGPQRGIRSLRGSIVYIDSFGNLITDIHRSDLPDDVALASVRVRIGSRDIWGIVKSYSDSPAGSLAALFGSSEHLEIASVGGNASAHTGSNIGTDVQIVW
jgi:S-adenosylmethionine hydrolase